MISLENAYFQKQDSTQTGEHPLVGRVNAFLAKYGTCFYSFISPVRKQQCVEKAWGTDLFYIRIAPLLDGIGNGYQLCCIPADYDNPSGYALGDPVSDGLYCALAFICFSFFGKKKLYDSDRDGTRIDTVSQIPLDTVNFWKEALHKKLCVYESYQNRPADHWYTYAGSWDLLPLEVLYKRFSRICSCQPHQVKGASIIKLWTNNNAAHRAGRQCEMLYVGKHWQDMLADFEHSARKHPDYAALDFSNFEAQSESAYEYITGNRVVYSVEDLPC